MLDDLFWIAEDFDEDMAAYLTHNGILLNVKCTQYGVTVWSDTHCDPKRITDCFEPFHSGRVKDTFTSFEEVTDFFNAFYGENDTSHVFDGEIGCSSFDSNLDKSVLSIFVENPDFHFFYGDVFEVHKFAYKGFTYVYDHLDDSWNGRSATCLETDVTMSLLNDDDEYDLRYNQCANDDEVCVVSEYMRDVFYDVLYKTAHPYALVSTQYDNDGLPWHTSEVIDNSFDTRTLADLDKLKIGEKYESNTLGTFELTKVDNDNNIRVYRFKKSEFEIGLTQTPFTTGTMYVKKLNYYTV